MRNKNGLIKLKHLSDCLNASANYFTRQSCKLRLYFVKKKMCSLEREKILFSAHRYAEHVAHYRNSRRDCCTYYCKGRGRLAPEVHVWRYFFVEDCYANLIDSEE